MSSAVLRPTVFRRQSATIVVTGVLSLAICGLAHAAAAASTDGQSAQQPTTKEERQAAIAARQAKRKQEGKEPEKEEAEPAEPAEQASEAPPAGRNQQEEQQRRAQEQQQHQAQMQARQEDQQREAENRQREAEERQQRQAQMQAQQEDQQRRAEERQQRQAEEQQRQAQMQAQQEDQQRQAQMQAQQEDQQRQAQMQAQQEDQQRQAQEQQRQAEEQQRQAQVISQQSARADEAYQGGGNSGPQPVPPIGNVGQAPPSNPVAAPSASAIKANGRDVTDVVFASGGVTRGQYRQVGAGTWEESAAGGGGSFQFQEAGRDDWSVYLRDSSRGVDIQLDLWRKQVLYSQDGGGEKRALYDITAANAGGAPGSNSVSPVVEPASAINANGRTVTDATYSTGGQAQGHFRQVGPGQWREESSSGGGYAFEEVARDDWSVYLRDSSRGVDIQLDLWRKQVLYSEDGGGEKRALYDISAAIAGTVPSNTSSQASSNAGTGSTGASDGGTSSASGGGTSNASGGGNSLFEKDFCWKDSYGRGVGTVPSSCPPGRDRIGLLCYTSCPANMKRVGFDCHSVCPSGMRDDGLFCRNSEYARTPYAASPADLFGPSNRERCEKANGSCEKAVGDSAGAIFYAKCKAGYSSWPLGICRPPQPNCAALGMGGQFDLSCAKIVSIGDPVTGSCPAGQQSDGGLCYPVCEAGYTGVGPVCWTGAPSGWVECGMGAAKDSFTCGQIVFGQVTSVGQLAFKIATLPTGAGAVAGAATAASKAERLTKLKDMYRTLKTLYQQNEMAIKNANIARKSGIAMSDDIALVDDDVVTEEDIVRIAAEIAAIADPTGVADVTASYTYPKCSKYKF